MATHLTSGRFAWGPRQETRQNGFIISGGVWLCARELEIARALAQGKKLKEIAYDLGIALSTTDNHRVSIYSKLGIGTVVELTHYMLSRGLIQNIYDTQA